MSDYRNPLYVSIPYEFKTQQDFPNEAVAARFQAYRDIIKSLIAYLDQYASVQEEIVRQQVRLQHAVGSSDLDSDMKYSSTTQRGREHRLDEDALSALNQFFLPIGNGSIQDIPNILAKYHQLNVQTGKRTLREIRQVIIPKLDALRKELLIKIKELKPLYHDFEGKLGKELSSTSSLLTVYSRSIDLASRLDMASTVASKSHHEPGNVAESIKKDPYLAKLKLQTQLKHQLREEEYLYRAYVNLQNAGEQLESIVVKDIQSYLGHFISLVEAEKSSLTNFLVPTLLEGFFGKDPNFEWQSYVERNLSKVVNSSGRQIPGKYIDLSFPLRKITDLNIPLFNSLMAVPVRQGYLERKSKFLKSNNRSYYVLTCSYLHEFKSRDLRKDPTNSISLDYCLVSEHSKDADCYKFDLYSKAANSLMHRSHTSVFKCESPAAMKEWLSDLKALTSLPNPVERSKLMSKRLAANADLEQNNPRVSRVSSILSALTNPISLHTGVSGNRSEQNTQKKHSIISRNESLASTPKNRLSSTFSNRNQQAPLIYNTYNERDNTIGTSAENGTPNADDSVDENGNLIIKSPVVRTASNAPPLNLPGIAVTMPYPNNANYSIPVNPQAGPQMIPQNYQYHVNQAGQLPQQFYDPVLQQFFTISAIPALQVAHAPVLQQMPVQQLVPVQQQASLHYSPNTKDPMPQYFPTSPQPNGQHHVQSEVSSPVQGQKLFDDHISGQNSPYPIEFGDVLQDDSAIKSQNGTNTTESKHIPDLADQVSRANLTDEK